ncbi:hypothetical protein HK405_009074 [Cladochytrium tenue]|nr:hypothetical protein HK405_009074 [Cladochytrium tenue]
MFDRLGPRWTLLFAATVYSFGYLLMFFAYTGRIAASAACMATYYFLAGTGSTAAYMSSVGVNLINFPLQHSGKIIGVLLVFYGFSGTIYSQVYSRFFSGDTDTYFLFLALSTGCSNLIAAATVSRVPPPSPLPPPPLPPEAPHSPTQKWGKNASGGTSRRTIPQTVRGSSVDFSALSIATIPELLILTRSAQVRSASLSAIPTLAAPSASAAATRTASSRYRSTGNLDASDAEAINDDADADASLPTSSLDAILPKSNTLTPETSPAPASTAATPGESPLGILRSPVFWLYAGTFIFQQGLTYISNVSAILAAVAAASVDSSSSAALSATTLAAATATHLTLISTFQAVGRLVFGLTADALARAAAAAAAALPAEPTEPTLGSTLPPRPARLPARDIDRAWLLLLAEMLLLLPAAVLGAGGAHQPGPRADAALVCCSVAVGLGFGAAAACFPGLTREFFGMRFYGTACGFVMAGVPLGVLLSNTIFGTLYDRETTRQRQRLQQADDTGSSALLQLPDSFACRGDPCFAPAFAAFAGLQVLPILACASLIALRAYRRARREAPASTDGAAGASGDRAEKA